MSDQNIFAAALDKIRAANTALIKDGALPFGIDQSRIVVEPPRESAHGDMATNAAMVLAKDAGAKPRVLAEAIAAKLRSDDLVAKAEVAGPGFINLTLKPKAWIGALRAVLAAGANYGRSNVGGGSVVNVEYVSANPTGPMHVGHCRGAVFGDALANLLAFTGFAVTREYYINDAGAQVDALARSAFLRYRQALGEDIGPIPEGLYPGDYLKPVGAELATEYGAALKSKPEAEWLPLVRHRAIEMMMGQIRNDLLALKVVHDVFFSERSLLEGPRDQVSELIAVLRRAGYVYEGRLPPPKGAPVEDWEDREQTLFRATAFDDDVDRPLMKSDGSYTYFAFDIAYHKNKVDRGFRSMIDVWGADHGGYVKRVRAAVSAVRAITNTPTADLDVKIVQLVKLLRNDAPLDFDLAKVIEQSRDNPVFYVQYGHARGQSVFRNAREVLAQLPAEPAPRASLLAGAPLERLEDAGELALMRRLALYPRLIEAAALAHEPHRIAFYLYDLASDFHAQWNRGKDASYLRFIIQNDPQITMARLALVQGVVTVLASGLGLLGVEAPDEMR
ncbi:MAG: arginine--tRNA ligase [Alphaproteobacteria bacterium]|nr:MAG: arginine--tRNA ligase [Alphaproteobacteria bacterium]